MCADLKRDWEICELGETAWSYAQLPYEPPVAAAGLLRSANLLYGTLRHEQQLERVRPLIESARAEFGLERTVWGVKFQDTHVGWEFYWYDHSDDIPLTLERVRKVCEPYLRWPNIPEGWMDSIWSISIDIDSKILDNGEVSGLHIYAPHPTQPPICTSYRLGLDGLHFENTYFLYQDCADHRSAAMDWLKTSFHGAGHHDLLDETWFPLDHVALAHKPKRDGFYLGALRSTQAADFLRRVGSPQWAVQLIDDPNGGYDHLLIEVAADLQRMSDGASRVVRSAFHGVV